MEKTRCPGCMKPKTGPGPCPHCGYDGTVGNAAHQLPVGTVLQDQYRIGKVLGQGGFGITYIGWDRYLDIPVAIKEYYPSGMVMREASASTWVSDVSGGSDRFHSGRERFLREAKVLARLGQVPQVVQVINYFAANNTAYIVMEYVEGETLKHHIRRRGGTLGVAETIDILGPVIRTMHTVHQAGVIHRDISPDNIMMLPDGGAKVLDFGAVRDVVGARADKPVTQSTETILKQGYAPLEQYQRRGNLGPWTDVYAMCATIYCCLTGQAPPDAPARMLGYEDIALEEIPNLTDSLKEALRHGMELRAENRTASMEELYRALIPEGKTVPAPRPEKLPVPETRPVPQKKKKFPAAIAAVCVVIAIAAVLLIPGGKVVQEEAPKAVSEEETTAPLQMMASGTCGEGLSWTLREDGLLTVSGSGSMDDFSDGGVRPWEDHAGSITALVLEEGVENLGAEAFRGTGLTEVIFPESVKTVGIRAFSDCPGLGRVTLTQNTVLRYDSRQTPIFSKKDTDIAGITLAGLSGGAAEDYAAVFGYVFESTGKTEYEARGSCTTPPYSGGDVNWFFDRDTHYLRFIGKDYMRWESPEFWEELPRSGASNAPWKQFREEVETVYLGEGVRNIGHNAFENFVCLNNIYIPETVEQIGAHSLRCSGLETLRLPRDCQLLLYSAAECENLREVITAVGYPKLGSGSLAGCPNLEKLYCCYYGFNIIGALGLKDDFAAYLSQSDRLFDPEPPKALTVYAPEVSESDRREAESYGISLELGFEGLHPERMGGCGSWGGWMLEDGVLTIAGCYNTAFYRSRGNEDQYAWNDIRYGIRCYPEEAPWYPWREEIHTVIVKPGVVTVNRGMFCDMPNLKTVDLGTTQKLYAGAFDNCGLEELVLPESLCTIASGAVVNCNQLKVLEVKGGSEGIAVNAFRGITALEELRFSGGGETFAGNIFADGIPEKTVLYVKEGSRAQRYAEQQGWPYVIE